MPRSAGTRESGVRKTMLKNAMEGFFNKLLVFPTDKDIPYSMPKKHYIILTILLLLTALTRSAVADDGAAVLSATGNLPAYLLEMPDSVNDILIADAANATLHRFVRSGASIVQKDQRYMSIGLNGTGKERAWDRKTPLGVYFITESLDTTRLDDKYGVAAYPLDYPNAWDRQQQRTGYCYLSHNVLLVAPASMVQCLCYGFFAVEHIIYCQ